MPGITACDSPTTQERLPFDRAALEELIDGVFGASGSGSPGAAVIVMRDDQVITQRQFGMASLEHGVGDPVDIPGCEHREIE